MRTTSPADAPTSAAVTTRSRRELRIAEIRRRRAVVATADPDLSAQTTNMVVNADSLWGPDDAWRGFLTTAPQDTPPAIAVESTVPAPEQQPSSGRRQAPARRGILRRRAAKPVQDAAPEDTAPPATIEDDVPFESFPVPPPGGRLRAGRLRAWITRLSLWVAPLVLIGGVAYSAGVDKGSSRVAAPDVITADQASTWHLSTFVQQQAAAFGVAYLQLCLTHPDPTNSAALDARTAALAQMSSGGVTPGCGWDGTGAPQTPTQITWAGTASPAPTAYTAGAAAHLDFLVVMPGDQTSSIDLAIWASSTTGTASFRVVSNPALLPLAPIVQAPTAAAPANVDDDLATSLPSSVLAPFLTAWAASNSVQLSLVLTSDATAAATQGLQGQVSDPQIDTTVVGVVKGKVGAYRDGDQVTAFVTVDWTSGHGVAKNNYAIALHRVAGRWLVQDITGGGFDTQGGGAIPTVTPSSLITYAPPTTSGS